jgi:hypothetical protein
MVFQRLLGAGLVVQVRLVLIHTCITCIICIACTLCSPCGACPPVCLCLAAPNFELLVHL